MSTASEILHRIWDDIRAITLEGPRRSWEYLVEMMAHASGWDTETKESSFIWPELRNHERFADFAEVWNKEVDKAKQDRSSFSEPLGEILMRFEPHHGLHDMQDVSSANRVLLHEAATTGTTFTGLDPRCGTGRYMIDAIVHHDDVVMHGVDTDAWMLRAALVNMRYLMRYASVTVKGTKTGTDLLVLCGRTVFMHGDPNIIDLGHAGNWMCAGWSWTPQPWETNLQIAHKFGFRGSWHDFQRLLGGPEEAARRLRELGAGEEGVRFNFDAPPMGQALKERLKRDGSHG